MKVLMVCLGNICRSPIAEELFRDACQKIGLQVQVDSAGTANYHTGKAPDSRMIRTASNFGHDISTLRARQFKPSDFELFDVIFAMDDENFSDLRKLAKNEAHASKIYRFQEYAEVLVPNFVPDPYYGAQKDFEHTFEVVRTSAIKIAEKLKNKQS
jgi:protein-tyrosine phosphatase